MNQKIPFLWTNDDITVGLSAAMQRQLDFLARFGLKGTFFVVPCPMRLAPGSAGTRPTPLTSDPELIALLKRAMAEGHEAHQHSTTHVCEENGTPDLRMFDLMGDPSKVSHSANRFVLERLWQVDALEAQIGWGQRVWTEAFGAPSEGFRPGCGAFCGNLYVALERLGFRWVSSRLVSVTGWMWAAKQYDYPLRLEGPKRPFRQGKLIEVALLDDVAFRIPATEIDRFVELGWKLWEQCVEHRMPYTLVSHFFALEHENGSGYAVHERLLRRILDTGLAEPMTLSQYCRRLQSGEFPMAEPTDLYPGPDNIPNWHILSQPTPTGSTV